MNAVHISYDMNGIPVKPINGTSVRDTLDKIQNGTIIPHNFKLYTDKSDTKTFTTHNYYNMRALLLGTSESVLEKYEGESYFNKFDVYILQHRGSNKGAQVRYAKNLKDITHEINYDRLYNKVYPFYHKETTSQTATSEAGEFKQVYIVGSKPYQDGWLSYSHYKKEQFEKVIDELKQDRKAVLNQLPTYYEIKGTEMLEYFPEETLYKLYPEIRRMEIKEEISNDERNIE